MLNITNHQGNANQNCNEIPLHIHQDGKGQKIENNKCCQRCGEIGTLVHCWCEYKMVQLLWKIVWWFLKKLKIELPYDPAIPLPAIQPKELKAGSRRNMCIFMFIVALFTVAKMWKQHKCPSTDEWIEKVLYIYIYIYNGIQIDK